MQTRSIAVFQCSSTCLNSVEGLRTIVSSELKRNVTTVSPDMISQWINGDGSLLVLPGGVCSGWDKELPNDFQENLANWIMEGNRIFATCAGAYYCSKQTTFSLSGREPINKTRQVQLFSGKCEGPLYPDLKIVKIRWHNGSMGHVVLLWGGIFDAESQENLKILGKYECKRSHQAAVIQSRVGGGIGILSSVHWEWGSKEVIKCNPQLDESRVRRKLDASIKFREECIHEMMQSLEMST